MAHNVETMAYAGEVPWHGLGKPVSNDLTPQQMREQAGVDWDVYKTPDYIKVGSKYIESGTQKLVRDSDHKVLTTVSEDWEPCSNHEAFEFFAEWVHEGDMEMHTAGSLQEGRIVWALAKVKESFELFGGDRVDSYLLFSNPHIYGRTIDIRFTPIRVVCNNTLTLSLTKSSNNAVKLNHRRAFDPNHVRTLLGIASDKFSTYKSMAEFLGKKKVTKQTIVEYFKEVFPGSKLKHSQEDELRGELSRPGRLAYDVLETQPGANFAEGTMWQAFNAVTYSIDHLAGRNDDTRLHSAWYGNGKVRKNKALELAIDYAKAA